jgi:hypothetical protein
MSTLHNGAFAYPDASAPAFTNRFYRGTFRPRSPNDDWKNQVVIPSDPFAPQGHSNQVRWIKFAVLTDDFTRIFYQDSVKYPFHYDYASQRLAPFIGVDRSAFDQLSLHPGDNQRVILGSILLPPLFSTAGEYGIQLVGLEPYPPPTVSKVLELVQATVHAPNGGQPLYMPTWEQFDSALANDSYFEERGFPLGTSTRWSGGSDIYAAGWALGRLVYIPAAEIRAAYTDGRLLPADILLTDGVPAEVPLVNGIISLRPSTPNSHVAILARSFGVPFVYLSDPDLGLYVQQLAGHDVALRAESEFGRDDIRVIDVHGALSAELRAEILALKAPPLLNFPAKASYGAIASSVDQLVPDDAKYFGGKAANFGLLRRTIPDNSPPAIAFSFDLWEQFMDQQLPNGSSLRAEIAARLAPFSSYPPSMAQLSSTLAGIRDLITSTARFTPAQQDAVISALAMFDPTRKIRFRSSTNMEDAEQFTGAGLYDSFSGCLLDDLDGDSTGPCGCDPTEASERGVFRAIQKVYASFYNDNAFLERLRHQVDESTVGMALLVHHSFPDEEANGVATMDATLRPTFDRYSAELATQLGEVSVTNPDGGALPEFMRADKFSGEPSFTLVNHSSLLPLGSHVLKWDADYRSLMSLLVNVTNAYRLFHPGRIRFLLDFEYKKEGGAMVVKQVRPLPLPSTAGQVTPFLIDAAGPDWVVFQGEYGDVFANHRLKSEWNLRTRNLRLTDAELQQSFYASSQLEYIDANTIQRLTGPPSSWPEAAWSIAGNLARDIWATGTGKTRRVFQLETNLVRQVPDGANPLLTHADFSKYFSVTYATPVPKLTQSGSEVIAATSETVRLVPRPVKTAGALLQSRSLSNSSGITVQTSFYWPEPPGLAAGYTAPLVEWVETRITGITSEPIILKGYYSQTYRPAHHNFGEDFLFEPGLEAGIPPAVLAELAAANIQALCCVVRAPGSGEVWVLSHDNELRRLP